MSSRIPVLPGLTWRRGLGLTNRYCLHGKRFNVGFCFCSTFAAHLSCGSFLGYQCWISSLHYPFPAQVCLHDEMFDLALISFFTSTFNFYHLGLILQRFPIALFLFKFQLQICYQSGMADVGFLFFFNVLLTHIFRRIGFFF